ncbi:Hint domain-containing protein [Litoreibacter janthinus]|uniref:Hint domain-containing protein n=1 Tax=Litoreibacter janthinus TaxID=670154 RepID=A0A1I6IFU9_9RHOB|nr:Hint domain-containing protein [Litoreibacter janthinus]SFR65519.1 Hint domain-containing protein [Litoreibacter janthinus]
MPTTFNVISLGNLASIDPTEGNTVAENASALVGQTFGSAGNALVNSIQSFSPSGSGFGGGNTTAYDMNNSAANETFSINGGAAQTFDGTSIYNATITYIDGTTATISAVIFQDTAGNTYLAPEFSANADQAALEAQAIRSVSLDSLVGNSYSGLTGTRETFNFVTCFTKGAQLATPTGQIAIEDLSKGDLLVTRDHGFQRIRWIGTAHRAALGKNTPIRIEKGALGLGLPVRDLIVSPQHRMLVSSNIAKRVAGAQEVLIPAKKLLGLPGIAYAEDMITVTYYHILMGRHEIVFAEGAPSESLLTGPMARQAIGSEALEEIQSLFPELLYSASNPARIIPKGQQMRELVSRHAKNTQPLLQA